MGAAAAAPAPPPAPQAGPSAAAGAAGGAAAAAAAKKKKARCPGEHKDNECIVCFAGKVEIMALPCKHWQLCVECAAALEARKEPCPSCRQPVNMWLKVIKN
jgi:hypothetical protein